MGKATIDRAVLALHRLTDKTGGRPVLENIFRNAGSFVAADGFVAGSVQHDEETYGGIPQAFRIPAKAAKLINKQIKTSAKHPRIAVEITDNTALISGDASPWPNVVLDVSEPSTVVPDLSGIKRPSSAIPAAVVQINASLMRQVADFLHDATADTAQLVELRIHERGQVIEFRSFSDQESEVLALLMPMHGLDKWLFDPVDGVEQPSQCDHHRYQQYRANSGETDEAA